jgi:A/G-specific adenine glycosylase
MIVESEGAFAQRILRWFDAHARELPWRNPPGRALPRDDPHWPYRVWLSEIMLQQTTVTAVKPYFEAFVGRWPSVSILAAAPDSDVMAAWAGLGYYARARNLLACARAVVRDYGGVFPETEAELLTLPGVGGYTAAAVAAIAYGGHAVVVDGNIERVISRVHAVETPMPAAKSELKRLTAEVTPIDRAGDFAQAMMDLGATICTPRSPACLTCPVNDMCLGRARATDFPVKLAKKPKPHRTGICWWMERGDDVFLVRRADKRMLGGMRALPSDDWDVRTRNQPQALSGGELIGTIDHVFTHFSLTLEIRRLADETSCIAGLDGEWWPKALIEEAGLPSLFAKAAKRAVMGEYDVDTRI